MDQVLLTDSPADDLLHWADRIKTLGEIISSLAWLAEKYPEPGQAEETLAATSEQLGMIIQDYAGSMGTVLSEAYPTLQAFFRKRAIT